MPQEIEVEDDLFDQLSSSPSIHEDEIDFQYVYALRNFVATEQGQVNAFKGDSMILLNDANSYWWLVRLVRDSSVGFLPAEHIETPYERLARLNKHRNGDLCSPAMSGFPTHKALGKMFKSKKKNPNSKSVTFTSQTTYVSASEYEYTDDDDEDDVEAGDDEDQAAVKPRVEEGEADAEDNDVESDEDARELQLQQQRQHQPIAEPSPVAAGAATPVVVAATGSDAAHDPGLGFDDIIAKTESPKKKVGLFSLRSKKSREELNAKDSPSKRRSLIKAKSSVEFNTARRSSSSTEESVMSAESQTSGSTFGNIFRRKKSRENLNAKPDGLQPTPSINSVTSAASDNTTASMHTSSDNTGSTTPTLSGNIASTNENDEPQQQHQSLSANRTEPLNIIKSSPGAPSPELVAPLRPKEPGHRVVSAQSTMSMNSIQSESEFSSDPSLARIGEDDARASNAKVQRTNGIRQGPQGPHSAENGNASGPELAPAERERRQFEPIRFDEARQNGTGVPSAARQPPTRYNQARNGNNMAKRQSVPVQLENGIDPSMWGAAAKRVSAYDYNPALIQGRSSPQRNMMHAINSGLIDQGRTSPWQNGRGGPSPGPSPGGANPQALNGRISPQRVAVNGRVSPQRMPLTNGGPGGVVGAAPGPANGRMSPQRMVAANGSASPQRSLAASPTSGRASPQRSPGRASPQRYGRTSPQARRTLQQRQSLMHIGLQGSADSVKLDRPGTIPQLGPEKSNSGSVRSVSSPLSAGAGTSANADSSYDTDEGDTAHESSRDYEELIAPNGTNGRMHPKILRSPAVADEVQDEASIHSMSPSRRPLLDSQHDDDHGAYYNSDDDGPTRFDINASPLAIHRKRDTELEPEPEPEAEPVRELEIHRDQRVPEERPAETTSAPEQVYPAAAASSAAAAAAGESDDEVVITSTRSVERAVDKAILELRPHSSTSVSPPCLDQRMDEAEDSPVSEQEDTPVLMAAMGGTWNGSTSSLSLTRNADGRVSNRGRANGGAVVRKLDDLSLDDLHPDIVPIFKDTTDRLGQLSSKLDQLLSNYR